jgi:hypothetical protein
MTHQKLVHSLSRHFVECTAIVKLRIDTYGNSDEGHRESSSQIVVELEVAMSGVKE